MLSHFSHVQLFATHGLWPTRLLCPWDSPGKNTGVGCYSSSRGSSQPRDQTHIAYVPCSGRWTLEPPGCANGVLPGELALLPSPPGDALILLEGLAHLSTHQTCLWSAESKIKSVALRPTAHHHTEAEQRTQAITSNFSSPTRSKSVKDGSF